MNKHLSVFMLNLRRIFYRVLLVLLIMCLIEGILLYGAIEGYYTHTDELIDYQAAYEVSYWSWRFEAVDHTAIFTDSGAQYVFLGAFLLLCGIFVFNGMDLGGKTSYTIRTLSINEKIYFIWESLSYLVCLVILLAAQTGIALAFCHLFTRIGGEMYHGSQTALILFYSNELLHSLLPMCDTSRVIRNVFLLFAVAIECGGLSYHLRHGKKSFTFFALVGFTVLVFPMEMGHWGMDAFTVLIALFCIIMTLYKVWRWRDEEAV